MSERQRLCCWAWGRKQSTVRVGFRCPDMPIIIKAQEKIVCVLTSKPIKESDRSGTFYQPAGTHEEYYKGENARLRTETATIRLQKHASMIFFFFFYTENPDNSIHLLKVAEWQTDLQDTFAFAYLFISFEWRVQQGFLLCRMSNPGGCVRPSMMSLRVSGVVSTVFASSSTLLLLTLLSTHCLRSALPIWSALPPTMDRNLERRKILKKRLKNKRCIYRYIYINTRYAGCKTKKNCDKR